MKLTLLTLLILLGCFQLSRADCDDDNCITCPSNDYCQACQDGYSAHNGACVQCDSSHCSTCDASGTCTGCQTGYSLNDNKCYKCQIDKCVSCSSKNYCESCDDNTTTLYYPNADGDRCVQCDVMYCQRCISDNSCGYCQPGYQPYWTSAGNNTGHQICILCSVDNCDYCSADDYCQQCAAGFQRSSSGECFKCSWPCQTCVDENTCATCKYPWFAPTPDANGDCILSTVPHCMEYSNSNPTQCTDCQSGYWLNSTSNTCVPVCYSPCSTCTGSTTCTSCPEGYLQVGSTCQKCQSKGCKTCSTSVDTCDDCSTGYYLFNQECKKCPGWCKTCTSNTQCTELKNPKRGLILIIIIIGGIQQKQLGKCSSTCSTCSTVNPHICTVCRQGYALKNGVCKPCASTCKTCDADTPSQCLSCYPYAFKQGTQCVKCSSNCLTCLSTNTNYCTSCKIKHYLSSGTCIQGCPTNCLYCSDANTCTQCQTGYALFQDSYAAQTVCQQCVSNCRECVQNQPGKCLSCGQGFYLLDQQCIQCESFCKTCSDLGCSECYDGYELTSSGTCVQQCTRPCATCSSTDTTKCQSCIAGYAYDSTSFSCIPILTCDGPCAFCPMGYALKDGICYACTKPNSQTCNPDDLNECYSCLDGYYLDDSSNTCSACTTGCEKCLSANACIKCQQGYTTTQTSVSGTAGFTCEACEGRCATCRGSTKKCTSCISGYTLKGWKCRRSFTFTFMVVLITDLSTFYRNFRLFMKALVLVLNSGSTTNQLVTINVIKLGSVQVQGSADPSSDPGTAQSGTDYSNLAATLAAGKYVGGMQVASSTVSTTGGSVGATGSEQNLGLILGITIPLGILILVGIGLFFYTKRNSFKDRKQYDEDDNGTQSKQTFSKTSIDYI